MTSESVKQDGTSPPGRLVRALTSSMWGYWFFLLAISMGMATVIYYVWLRGNL
jgi:hypothetical protein